jgi:enterochelin esterase family protein
MDRLPQIVTFGAMQALRTHSIQVEKRLIQSRFLKRTVTVDVYVPAAYETVQSLSLLLINDGQNLPEMHFDTLLGGLMDSGQVQPLFCAAIHAGEDRRNEYATAKIKDYEGRGGATAQAYQQFILEELLPHLHTQYRVLQFASKSFAGFSMGGLCALDIVWNYPEQFSIAGVFSGSLWWRTKALEDGYNEATDRIMHQQVKEGAYHKGLRFYFTTGSLDETADRNNNGIIDSIDDTLDLIAELENEGYQSGKDIQYINYEDGRHDIVTWARALPQFLLWGWGVGIKNEE